MTLTLTELLTAYEIDKGLDREDRKHQGLTASSFGSCNRRTAFALHDYPVTNTQPLTSVATVGSLLHMGVAVLWLKQGYEVEVTGEHGTLDAINRALREVRDLKSVTRSRFDYWAVKEGPPDNVWKQAHVYGVDHGADEGWTILIDVLCRETGRTATYQMAFDPDLADEAMAELASGSETVINGVPPIPDDRYGHGDPVCDNCPFLDGCWGASDDEHPVFDGADIEKFGIEYLEAQVAAKEADERKKIARSRLVGASGPYGQVKVTWSDVAGRHVEYDARPYRKLNVTRV